jgi:hypothetical protein
MKKINNLIYEPGSGTIRQLPENYCIAYKRNSAWVCEPDLACNKRLALKVFTKLLQFKYKYGTGETLIQAVTTRWYNKKTKV